MAKKLFEKAGLIQLPVARPAAPGGVVEGDSGRAKTAPGAMVQFIASQSAVVQEAESLRDRVAEFAGAHPARRLDPASIRASQWANRHERSFADNEFVALRAEIESAGGNVQPIKVRRLVKQPEGVGPSNPPAPMLYEIVFGHRRHRACLELGLPVLAFVEDVSDQQLFVEMERENRQRKDLSAWEQGAMYARALERGLYASNRQLAAAIGRDLGDLGKALALARLPQAVIEAFPSPLDLQFRWAKPLSDAQQKDPEALIARAIEVRRSGEKASAKDIFDSLVGTSKGFGPSNPLPEITVRIGGRTVALVGCDGRGRTVVKIETPLEAKRQQALAKLIEGFLAK